MGSNTYYPPATVCYRDPSQGRIQRDRIGVFCNQFPLASCPEFGTSGSGVVREANQYLAYGWPEYGEEYKDDPAFEIYTNKT